MTDSHRNPGNAGEPSSVGAVRSAGRRRLLQAGISTAPVLMTVVSRPVLASLGNCQAPSGFVSGNASNANLAFCQGLTPAQWVGNQTGWPSLYHPTATTPIPPGHAATLFSDVFTPDLSGGPTFLAVLQSGATSGALGVASLCVAAALNVAPQVPTRIPPSIYTLATIKDLWKEYATNGAQFRPTLTAVWNEAEIIEWLKTTMSSG